ncbi:MAG: adenine deaminase [Saprospiraceae bacterium]|nr:adenine deaminase [Saprospiraceae bacterium]
MEKEIAGLIPDFEQQLFYPGILSISQGRIKQITRKQNSAERLPYILPGFVDSHIHIESSMMVPSEFARLAVIHGTVGTVSDPHEIANVCGMEGVRYMLENGKKVPFKFNFGAPSCVPATSFETAGARLDANEVEELLQNPDIKYLSEMMNFPGVLNGDQQVWEKIKQAKKLNKPIDGHAPGLRGKEAEEYIQAGISTDHECFTYEEALDKLSKGMKIIIREGSAAKNFDELIDLLNDFPDHIMFCSDDKHPDSLIDGHINLLCTRAMAKGIDIFKILRAASINPVKHYALDIGLLRTGDPADFIVVEDLESLEIKQTFIDGQLVMESGRTQIDSVPIASINNFHRNLLEVDELRFDYTADVPEDLPIIEALDGQLITLKSKINYQDLLDRQQLVSNPALDILKIVVVDRYGKGHIGKAFVKNFGLKNGAIASSVAHDSHNIVAVGTDDHSLEKAINAIISTRGGLSFYQSSPNEIKEVIPLPIAGLMSDLDGFELAYEYTRLDKLVKEAGSKLSSPFMTLSFMALLVIPHIKLSDRGLFDADHFQFI